MLNPKTKNNFYQMKKIFLITLAALPLLLSSCSTPPPPQAYHAVDNSALVVDVLDSHNSRVIMPTPSGVIENAKVVDYAKNLAQRQTAVIILENYTETEIGDQFRDRGTPWFIGLRCLGYEHIVFLQGNGSANPEGLVTLVNYD
jgi:hypothetical protein